MIWMYFYLFEKKFAQSKVSSDCVGLRDLSYWLFVSSFPGCGRVDADIGRVGSVSVDLLPGFVRLGRVIAVS